MSNRTCKIDGCDRPARARGWCTGHYERFRKSGDAGPAELQRKVPQSGVCEVYGCDNRPTARNLCKLHWQRWYRNGDPEIVLPTVRVGADHALWTDVPKYSAVHRRLRSYRGPAKGFACVDCGRQAEQWAYDHADPEEMADQVGGSVVPYSLDMDHYQPMCIPCHKRFDLAHLARVG